ncbi:hypothetical protein XENOCAPTIV_030697, partial [Xenoophorus captivus]
CEARSSVIQAELRGELQELAEVVQMRDMFPENVPLGGVPGTVGSGHVEKPGSNKTKKSNGVVCLQPGVLRPHPGSQRHVGESVRQRGHVRPCGAACISSLHLFYQQELVVYLYTPLCRDLIQSPRCGCSVTVTVSVCVSASSPHLHALHGVLSERPVCRVSGPPATGNSEPTCSRNPGGSEQSETQPGAGEQGDAMIHRSRNCLKALAREDG